MGEYLLSDKPKILYLLVGLWALLALTFIILGLYSLELLVYMISPKYAPTDWDAMLFFGMVFITTVFLIFGIIFAIFASETYKGKAWVWNAGVIISTIFIVIFSFMLASIMLTALQFRDNFTIQTLEASVISFLIDLGIIFLITRPAIKEYMKN